MIISFNSVYEEKPGEKWKALFDRTWPHYKNWFLSEGYFARKGYLTSVTMLEQHMPELLPTYKQLLSLTSGGDLEARFLTMYSPPAYMSGCSQVAWTKDGTSLIRNYDYTLKMFEGTMLYSNWLQPVIGVSDCTWGLLDGMNASGLAASLTFGGRKVTGEGFGIPLIIRYILETSTSVKGALAILNRVPVHMAYNVTLIDASGEFATVYLSPDRAPVYVTTAVATNHQVEIEWSDYAFLTGTIERKRFLEELVSSEIETETSMLKHFLHPPLYNTNFEKSFGTLYTIIYRVAKGEAEVHWPEMGITQSFSHFNEERVVPFNTSLRKGVVF
ncbi:MAG: C45 family autoproteolytic acyltransferase/hydrolase [Cyclobacteriaceae bacterium]|nr:C45 family autoproteolytic acyltransferase/hydrolase [Cyclobacteriaceae bacterium]